LTGLFKPSIPEYEAFLSSLRAGAGAALLKRGRNTPLTKARMSNPKPPRIFLGEFVGNIAESISLFSEG
jgi:hypothetical protein